MIMKNFNTGSVLVIIITFLLFALALFITTGFTHDLLLEAGVFLVSVKLIAMAYKFSVISKNVESDLV